MATRNDCKNADVYVYRRWSDDKQTDGDSGRRQHDRAEDWCRAKQLKITAEETDDGISAFRGKSGRHAGQEAGGGHRPAEGAGDGGQEQ